MTFSLTADDVVAAVTIGGSVLAPVVGYVRFVHAQQSTMWRALDKIKDGQAGFVTRDEQDKYRLELKGDLKSLEERLVKEMERLIGHRGV